MPLISSPIDGSPMREIERYGVKIDICQTSGGIWLDKGELEKIIMMIREEALQDGSAQGYDRGHEPPPPPRADSYAQQSAHHGAPKRKKRDSMFDNLMDIFDL